jgi:hypothetical protein
LETQLAINEGLNGARANGNHDTLPPIWLDHRTVSVGKVKYADLAAGTQVASEALVGRAYGGGFNYAVCN